MDTDIAGLVDESEYIRAQRDAMEEQTIENSSSMSYADWLAI